MKAAGGATATTSDRLSAIKILWSLPEQKDNLDTGAPRFVKVQY
jgi:hypothetical protein